MTYSLPRKKKHILRSSENFILVYDKIQIPNRIFQYKSETKKNFFFLKKCELMSFVIISKVANRKTHHCQRRIKGQNRFGEISTTVEVLIIIAYQFKKAAP